MSIDVEMDHLLSLIEKARHRVEHQRGLLRMIPPHARDTEAMIAGPNCCRPTSDASIFFAANINSSSSPIRGAKAGGAKPGGSPARRKYSPRLRREPPTPLPSRGHHRHPRLQRAKVPVCLAASFVKNGKE